MQQAEDILGAADLLNESAALWHGCGTQLPKLGRQYTRSEQKQREAVLDEFLAVVAAESRNVLQEQADREHSFERIASAFACFARAALDFNDGCLDLLLRDGFSAVGSDLAEQARAFDPQIPLEEIIQACRNAWTACGMQMLLGGALRLTPAIFAYSMLYPYSDNYLDCAAVSPNAKLIFSIRFRRRLMGERLNAIDDREAAIWRLIGLIEEQYRRADYPQVYASLLAIHRAQEESLSQMRNSRLTDPEVLRLSFAKGGASVLADACLAGGSLTQAEAKFAFLWGVLLQLGDDLQDLNDDLANGSRTLFSQSAGSKPLDELTSRVLQFGGTVAMHMNGLASVNGALKDLLMRSSRFVLIRAAGQAREFYSKAYLAELETYSPFRFGFLRKRDREVARKRALYAGLFEVFLGGGEKQPVFPMIATLAAVGD